MKVVRESWHDRRSVLAAGVVPDARHRVRAVARAADAVRDGGAERAEGAGSAAVDRPAAAARGADGETTCGPPHSLLLLIQEQVAVLAEDLDGS